MVLADGTKSVYATLDLEELQDLSGYLA